MFDAFVSTLPYLTPGVVGLLLGWYGHMKFGAKAQAAVDTAAAAVAEVKKEV